MNHTESLTRYIANFVDELIQSGLKDVVISPGSRSTPLAMMVCEHPGMNHWVIIDERSAAFFAIGMAKKKKRPVAVLCTSGTAAANYFPAIVEAYYSRVPLLVLTADRPHELRDVGAPQSIDQNKIYGNYAKWYHEMALPDGAPAMLDYVRSKASRAVYTACEGNAGPVHLNFPFREPLVPDVTLDNLWGKKNPASFHPVHSGKRRLDSEQLDTLLQQLRPYSKGLIVCGPQTDDTLADAIAELAAKWNTPVLADPLSQVRAGNHAKSVIIEGYDAFLRNDKIRSQLKPEWIIRFGAMPVSKAYLFYVKENSDALQFVVDDETAHREPAGNQTEFIYADAAQVCYDLTGQKQALLMDEEWLKIWQNINQITKKQLMDFEAEKSLTEGNAVRTLADVLPDKATLYVGNSMAVRDLDTFFMATSRKLSVLANRGANGIDGMVSSGLGAATAGDPVTLLLGDLSLFHDMNGLLAAKHYQLNLTILLINNDGGGIFSFLPQAQYDNHFETLFGTPLNIDFKQAVAMYGGTYFNPDNLSALKAALDKSYQTKGLSVVEVKTDRSENMQWHRNKWHAVAKAILENRE